MQYSCKKVHKIEDHIIKTDNNYLVISLNVIVYVIMVYGASKVKIVEDIVKLNGQNNYIGFANVLQSICRICRF